MDINTINYYKNYYDFFRCKYPKTVISIPITVTREATHGAAGRPPPIFMSITTPPIYLDNEEELRLALIHAILDKKNQAEREEKAKREALEKIEPEEEEKMAVLNILRLEAHERVKSGKEIYQKMTKNRAGDGLTRRSKRATN